MSEENDKSKFNDLVDIPEAVSEPKRKLSIQLIWIIPLVAAIIGLSLIVRSYMEKGPQITITFQNGEGIEAGKTKIKYKDVQIGDVRNIAIAPDKSYVIVTAELKRDAIPLLVEDTRFWVVKARISGGGISGLSTLTAGSYIALDAGKSNNAAKSFKGLDRPPVVTQDVPGSPFLLHSADIGSLDVSSPIFYRRVQVGEVTGYELDKDGKGVTLSIFIRAPFDNYVKSNTLFWHASGIDFSIDANGVKVNTESVLSVLMGGIAFQTPEDKAKNQQADKNSIFTLFATHDEALKRPDTVVETYTLIFKESVRGLAIGAPVDLRGVTVGEVSKINVELDAAKKEFSIPVEIKFYPERLRAHYRGLSAKKSAPLNTRELLNSLVDNGFRAQLRSGSLLTGQLYVALDFFPKTAARKVDWSKNPPEFPTMANSFEQFQTAFMQIVQKIEKFPLEELSNDTKSAIRSLDTVLKSADKLIKQVDSSVVPEASQMIEDAKLAIVELRKTVETAGKQMKPDSTIQIDLRETMREMQRAAAALKNLGEYLEKHPESLIRGRKGDEK